jgi:hypothetical protein
MKTTAIYRVLTVNSTVIADFVREELALYEMRANDAAVRVECNGHIVAEKQKLNAWEMEVVYSKLTGEMYTEMWITSANPLRVWNAAKKRAPLNYLVDRILLPDGEVYEGWDGIPHF